MILPPSAGVRSVSMKVLCQPICVTVQLYPWVFIGLWFVRKHGHGIQLFAWDVWDAVLVVGCCAMTCRAGIGSASPRSGDLGSRLVLGFRVRVM
mmetsp:Transcript_41156/g.113125  ORF Transcript_41156/g.113125 Transcript_41156/m.113125 type:complete len:94 (+) Transcript_41156:250-531(+)